MRILAIVCSAFATAVFACVYVLPLRFILFIAAGLAAACLLLLLPKLRRYKFVLLGVLPLVFGLVFFWVNAQFTVVRAEKLLDTEAELSLRLTADPQCYDEYGKCEVLITEGPGRGLRAVLYCYDTQLADDGYLAGDYIKTSCSYSTAGTRYGEQYDNYYAKGQYLVLKAREPLEKAGQASKLQIWPQTIRRALLKQIDALFPEDVRGFMKALMLGEKTGLYADLPLSYAMKAAGFMHIVAVSGMHLSYLVKVVWLFLKKTRRSSAVCIVLIWCFALITGAGPSVLRSAFMLTVFLSAPFFRREADDVTALTLALAVLLLANPYAAASVSLQLSFGAMAGIIFITEKLMPEFKSHALPVKVFSKVLGVLLASVGVTVFTLPLSAIHFGSFSLVAPISCLVSFWAVPLGFCGGFLSVIISAVYLPAGTLFAAITAYAARYIMLVAGIVGKLSYALIYFNTPVMWLWLLLVYCLIGLSVLSKLSLPVKVLLPLGLGAVTLASALTMISAQYRRGDAYFTVLDVGQGQSICLQQGDSTAIIDCGSSFTLENAGQTTGAYLRARGRRNVDYLILTHLHRDHANGVLNLLQYINVTTVIVPQNADDSDGLLEDISAACEARGITLLYLNADTELSCGLCKIALFAPTERGNTNERCISMLISAGGIDALVTGDAPKSVEIQLSEEHELSGTEIIVAGHHGSASSATGKLLAAAGGNTAIISCGYNTYGHPTYQTLARLSAYGYNVYRTDLHGDVEVTIPYDEVLNGKT